MVWEIILLSRFFVTWTNWTSLFKFLEKMFWLQVIKFLDLKQNWIFGKVTLWKEILKCSHCCLALRVKKDISRSHNNNHLEKLLNKTEHFSPTLSTQVYDWLRNPYPDSSVQPKNWGGKTLWIAVWSCTHDDIYWPIPGQVLDLCERQGPCHSQGGNKHIAAVFDFLYVWSGFFLV